MYIIVCMHIYRIVCMQIGKNLSMYSCVVHMKYCISDLHYVLYSTLYLRECGDFLRIYLLLSICIGVHPPKQCRRPGAEFWGGTETFFADQDFWITFFRKKFPFHCKNFWWPFFSHRPGFSDFPFLFPNFPYLTMLNVVYDPFLKGKTPFFTLFMRIQQHYFSKYWGDGCMDRPHLKFWGGPSTQFPYYGLSWSPPLPLRQWCISLCFRFPIKKFEKIFRLREEFSQFDLFQENL